MGLKMLHRPVVGPIILLISGEPGRMIAFRAVVAGASIFNVVVRPPKPYRQPPPQTVERCTCHLGKWYPTYAAGHGNQVERPMRVSVET